MVKVALVLALEDAVGQGEGEKLVELRGGVLLEPGAEPLIGVAAGFGIEEDGARFGEELGRLVDAVAQELGDGVARLVLERELLLPPDQELAAVLLDLLVAGIGLEVEAEPFVWVVGIVIPPPIPAVRAVWQRRRQWHTESNVGSR